MKQIQEDKIISEFLKSLGPWREFVVIGGGFALFIYKLYLADPKLENLPVGTRDIDSLIPRRVPEISKKNIAKYLNEAGFIHVFKDVDIPATESFVKEIDGVEVEIEFLTDSATRDDKNKNVVIAGIVAQPLSYLTLSLQTTMEFRTYSGAEGKVVSPGEWIFHKGLTFTRRKSSSKMLKDLYGIWYVTTQLGDFSDQAFAELAFLSQQHPKWLQTFQKQLSNWMNQASPAEWSKLESQDPSGKLKKLGFERISWKYLLSVVRFPKRSECRSALMGNAAIVIGDVEEMEVAGEMLINMSYAVLAIFISAPSRILACILQWLIFLGKLPDTP